MTRNLMLCVPLVGLGIAAGMSVDRLGGAADAGGRQEVKPEVSLPLTRVVLFNSGVGYFSRSGEVEGDARVDLSFPEQDINDLLKSMVLEDFGGGRVAAVSYDSREPVGRTLSSFAVNLDGQPSFDAIVGQMRGERVEVVPTPGAANHSGKLSGVIVGVERRQAPEGNGQVAVAFLNLWCAEGLRSVRLSDVQQLRFLNPVIESEFRRALDVLAHAHDSQKKAVTLHFAGDRKRGVQVGYVVESPIWKTSYRLVLGDKEKPYLQGWAMVENTTDEDWAGVKMALVSGRPISFKMDLHNPLYADRPTVEPELFASLRPVAYRGGYKDRRLVNISVGVFGGGGDDLPGLLRKYHELVKKGEFSEAEKVALAARELDPDNPALAALVNLAKASKRVREQELSSLTKEALVYGGLADAEKSGPLVEVDDPVAIKLDAMRRAQRRGSPDLRSFAQYDVAGLGERQEYAARLGRELATRVGTDSVGTAATAAALGDSFQYAIDHPVTLARRKSAMLPIVGKAIEGQKVSIYNEAVQKTHPLLGLKFKNTSGAHLNQGPVTVFEGSVYAGDTRVLDVQPNEERLVSYAIDLGTEVDPQVGPGTQQVTGVRAVKGIITQSVRLTEEKKYRITNRSQTDRTLLVEHPNRTSEQFKLVDTDKPVEDTPDVFRFQLSVKAGETKTFTVREEKALSDSVTLTSSADDAVLYFTSLAGTSPALKRQLQEAAKVKAAWNAVRREQGHAAADLERLNLDQDRIRKNLRETPKEAEVYATYLKKLSDQEKEIDALTARQKKLMADEFAARKRYEDFLADISD